MSHAQHEPEIKQLDEMLIAGIRSKGKYADVGKYFSELGKALGFKIAGKAFSLYYDQEYKEDDADFEVCFPIRKAVEKEGITVHTLAATRCVSLTHRGPYDTLKPSYERVLKYMESNQLKPGLPIREVYIKGPGMIFKGNPEKYVTEIQFPISSE